MSQVHYDHYCFEDIMEVNRGERQICLEEKNWKTLRGKTNRPSETLGPKTSELNYPLIPSKLTGGKGAVSCTDLRRHSTTLTEPLSGKPRRSISYTTMTLPNPPRSTYSISISFCILSSFCVSFLSVFASCFPTFSVHFS